MATFVVASLTIASLWFGSLARAEMLSDLRDADLVKLLNDLQVVETPEPAADLPFSIRLFRLWSDGECDGTPRSCPTESIYIAVSEHGEYPERRLYQLPASHGWELEQWLHLPAAESADEYFEFTMKKQVPASDPSSGWWSTERYKVRVNPYRAAMERAEQ